MLTNLEKELFQLLRELVDHTSTRNALGEVSREFCAGCQNNHILQCSRAKIVEILDTLEPRIYRLQLNENQRDAQIAKEADKIVKETWGDNVS